MGGGRGQKALGQHPARTQPEIGWAHACAVHSPSIRLLRTSERRAPLRGMEEESGALGAPIFWVCLFVRLLQLPCLSVGRAVTKATQTSQRDLPLSCLSWSPRKRTQTTERLEARISQGKKSSSLHILLIVVSNSPQLAQPIMLKNQVIFLLSANLHHFLPHPYSWLMTLLPILRGKSRGSVNS